MLYATLRDVIFEMEKVEDAAPSVSHKWRVLWHMPGESACWRTSYVTGEGNPTKEDAKEFFLRVGAPSSVFPNASVDVITKEKK